MRVSEILAKTNYQKELDTPEWKSFTGNIKKQVGYCECCKRSNVGLEVHHIFYERDRKPWEYDKSEVVVLCRACHGQLHIHLKNFRKFVFGKMNPQVFQILNGALAVAFDKYDPLVFAHALAEFVSTRSMVERYAQAWGMSSAPKQPAKYNPEDVANTTKTTLREAQREDAEKPK